MAISTMELGADALAAARADYEGGEVEIPAILARLGIPRAALYVIINRQGWRFRRPRSSRRGRSRHACAGASGSRDDGDLARQAAEVERLSARNMRTLRGNLRDGGDADRIARTIALQTRTLESLRRLRTSLNQDDATHDGEPPRSLAELRDELRSHLLRIREEQRSGALAPAPDHGGADLAPPALADPLSTGPTPADG